MLSLFVNHSFPHLYHGSASHMTDNQMDREFSMIIFVNIMPAKQTTRRTASFAASSLKEAASTHKRECMTKTCPPICARGMYKC